MALPAWFDALCSPEADRREVVAAALGRALVSFERLSLGRFVHLHVHPGRAEIPAPGETVLIAHYDRVEGSPGANDNGASVLALIDYLSRRRRNPLRVVFTDGEELAAGATAVDQGSYALASRWARVEGLFPVVLDMTGIGDTFVLGHLGGLVAPGPEYDRQRLRAKRVLAACGAGDPVEVNTPFSDDLGFLRAGVPAVQLSLLPRKEALAYRKVREKPGELSGEGSGPLPPSWAPMHTADDRPEHLWPQSRVLVGQLLDKLTEFPARRI